jgi:hypothetical protein
LKSEISEIKNLLSQLIKNGSSSSSIKDWHLWNSKAKN